MRGVAWYATLTFVFATAQQRLKFNRERKVERDSQKRLFVPDYEKVSRGVRGVVRRSPVLSLSCSRVFQRAQIGKGLREQTRSTSRGGTASERHRRIGLCFVGFKSVSLTNE